MEITEADKEILRLINRLTQEANGKPPTLAEIALAAGLQSSSRANIQRQLTRLRPAYVDWTSASRSLQLTPAGLALIGLELITLGTGVAGRNTLNTLTISTPISDFVLPLLASGISKMVSERINNKRPVQAPYPREWQRGMNLLAAECLLRGIEPPHYLAQAIAWCKQPIKEWPVRFGSVERFYDAPLLDEDENPTFLCLELAQSISRGNAELELYQSYMAKAVQKARQLHLQSAYVALRRYLIENPVISSTELVLAAMENALDAYDSELYEMYEQVPASVFENNEVLLCGFCGWTLERNVYTGRLRCGDDRCRSLTANFTRGTHSRQFEKGENPLRVNRAIRRYVVAAGYYEINAFKALERMKLDVELWPGYDQYDLRISFNNGESWAVDVKDWSNPFLLLRKLEPLPGQGNEGLAYSRAFYAVPDERVQEDRTYLDILRNATKGQPFEIVTLSQLLELSRQRQRETGG